MSRSLIIVAHGSSVKPSTAQIVTDAAMALSRRPDIRARFDAVEARFLKQEPLLSKVTWDTDEALVIPFFMADGYFVETVLAQQIPEHARQMSPLGTADLSHVAGRIVREFDPDAHLVLVGHGTERNPASAASVEALADTLRQTLRSVTTAFVDQEPRLQTTWQRVPDDEYPVVVLPYFAFAGPHTQDDIPEGLGLRGGRQQVGRRTVYYAPPIGTAPEIVDVLAALALR